MTVRYEQFLPEVLPYVRDCPEVVAVNAIRNACIDFCDRTLWLLYNHAPVSIIANQSTYALSLPTETTTARVLDAWYNNSPLAPIGEDDIKQMFSTDWRAATGTPAFYTHLDPTEIVLAPTPVAAATNALTIIMALRPTRSSVTVDDTLYERWAEEIGCGARARLHQIPGQPFYDIPLASRAMMMFDHGVGLAKIERNRGLTRHVSQVRFTGLV